MAQELLKKDVEILNRVKKVTIEELGVKEDEVTYESSFTEDLGADSLDVVELVMAFEEEFSIDIPDDDVTHLKTIKDAVEYIKSLPPIERTVHPLPTLFKSFFFFIS